MPNYNIHDYIPAGSDDNKSRLDSPSDTGNPDRADMDEPHTMNQLDLSPEQVPETDTATAAGSPDPEIAPVEPEVRPKWALAMSTAFAPILIPTYCMALAVWITPLSRLSENIRLSATFVVFLLTAVAPMMYMLTMNRLGFIKDIDIAIRKHRIGPAIVALLGITLAAIYMYRAMAPGWLTMTFAAGGVIVLLYFSINFFTLVSGHTMGMGAITALIYYLGANEIADVTITPWIAVAILLSGLVGSARLALGRHTAGDVAIGFSVGTVAMYAMLHIHIFDRIHPVY